MSRRLLVIMAIVALVLVGGAVAVVETGGGSSRSASAGSAAPTTRAKSAPPGLPAGAWQLPLGQTTQGLVSLGFPQTTLGAVSMAYSTTTVATTVDATALATIEGLTQLNPTDVAGEAQATAAAGRTKFGLPAAGPTGATISLAVNGCRVIAASSTRVVAALEGQLTETDATHGQQGASIVVPAVMMWTGSDWKVDEPASTAIAIPQATPPGPTGASGDGWHTCTVG